MKCHFFDERPLTAVLSARSRQALPFVFATLMSPALVADELRLDEVVVKGDAARPKAAVSIKSEALPTAVTVIDAEEIKRTNFKDFSDLLRRVPGINAYAFGQNDIGAPIKMRGFTGTGAHGGDVAVYSMACRRTSRRRRRAVPA